jgi:alpha-ketoglutarate-dependent taurine dioxygenase
MVWANEGTGQPHLQILACCVYALTTVNTSTGEQTVCKDLQKVRSICHNLLRKVYAPENIYAHRWEKGDLVIFHNRSVMHSITGQLATSGEKRLLWQCSLAGSDAPKGYRAE